MKIFTEKNTELKDFEEIILDIEKERDTLDEGINIFILLISFHVFFN